MDRRIKWIDIAKGIGIILVIIGHTFRDEMLEKSFACYFLRNFIYSFHMQLFFVISGYLLEGSLQKYTDKAKIIEKKIDSLLKPFIVYSLLIYVIFECANLIPGIVAALEQSSYEAIGIIEYAIKCIEGMNPYAVHLWYLLALFIFEVTTITFRCIFKEKANGILLCFAFLMYMSGMNLNPQIMILNAILKRFLFFVLGQFLYGFTAIIYKDSSWILAGEVLSVLLITLDVVFTPKLQSVLLRQVYYIIILAAKCFVVYMIIRLSTKLQNNTWLMKLGRNSFCIYILHQPWCAMIGMVLYNLLGINIISVCALCAVLSLIIPNIYLEIIHKSHSLAKLSKTLLNIS